MESNINVELTKLPGRECLVVRTRGFNTATINGLRRTMLTECSCYGFVTEIDPYDYKVITGTKEERRNTVLACTLNSQSIPVMAQRCSRLCLHTDKITDPLLASSDTRKVFFVVCQRPDSDSKDLKELMTKPLVAEKLTETIHSHDLIPVVLTVNDDNDDDVHFEYNKEESDIIKDNIKHIFPFNELIAKVDYGQRLNIVLKPVMGKGSDNVRWSPCTFLYRFTADPGWAQHNHAVVDSNGQVRRKIEGERSFKHLFVHKPPLNIKQSADADEPYNKFGRPYGHILMFQYNGKMPVVQVFNTCVTQLTNAADLFLEQYINANTEKSMMSKEASTVSSTDGTMNSEVELLYIPRNTQDELPSENYILTDATIGNLFQTKMLEIIESKAAAMKLDDSVWRHTHIAYKIPHPLIRQCQMQIKIPDTLKLSHKELVTQAVDQIKLDLQKLRSAVLSAENAVEE